MKSYLRFQRFQNESPIWVRFCQFFFLIGLATWFGALVFFAFGAAGTPFKLAKEWNLTGTNPLLPDQIVSYKTIGGAITSQMIMKLNQLEVIAFACTALALFLAWMPDHNRNSVLLIQTFLMAAMGILLLIYSEKFGARMFEIQRLFPIDYSIENTSLKTLEHIEFDSLHKKYSTMVSINAILCFCQFVLFSINPIARVKSKK